MLSAQSPSPHFSPRCADLRTATGLLQALQMLGEGGIAVVGYHGRSFTHHDDLMDAARRRSPTHARRVALPRTMRTPWDLDWDTYEMWDVQRVQHTDGRVAYLAEVGGEYSFSGAHRDYVGAGATVEAAKAHLQSMGFTDVEDYRARKQ